MDWTDFRSKFPALSGMTYLNTAGGGAMSTSAARAGRSYYDAAEQFADASWDDWLIRTESVRESIACFIGARPADLSFLQNASLGLNIAARLFDEPVEVLALDREFPSCTTPWMRAGHNVKFLATDESGAVDADDFGRAIGPETRAVVLSSVQFASGFRADLKEIGAMCRSRGVFFVVDATQSICAYDIDVERDQVDALVFSGYKWATAGYGIAVLCMSRTPAGSVPPLVGWRSAKQPYLLENDRLDLVSTGIAHEMGHPLFPGIFTMGAAVSLFEGTDMDEISLRIDGLTAYLRAVLADDGFKILSSYAVGRTSGITLVGTDDADRWAAELKKRNIWVSARRGGLRISVHAYNSRADINLLREALVDIRECE